LSKYPHESRVIAKKKGSKYNIVLTEVKMSEFIHLHNHSHYSILDGITKIKDLAVKTSEFGQPSVALTDHGNMFGAMEFNKECKAAGVHPIYGAELYIAPGSRFEKIKDEKYYHIVLLARDYEGYKNLLLLTSLGYIEGFYSKPRIDRDLLQEHSKGLVMLTACLSGEIPHLILAGKDKEAYDAAGWYLDLFGKENFYLEVQNHRMPEEIAVTAKMVEIASKTGIGLVATNDSHYIGRDDSKLQEIAFAIRDKKTLKDDKRFKFVNDEFYYKSPDEMIKLFFDLPEAVKNTMKIAEMCIFDLKFSKHLPVYSLPQGETAHSVLEKLSMEGLHKRFKAQVPSEYSERIGMELELIKTMGFSNYFLIVSDFVRFAKEKGILVGPGRGSAAGSLISYSLSITDIDPLKYNLLFERFLNPERISMPDIDVDFQDDRRDEVKEYIRMKYGYDKTADIITFGVLKSRASLKDVGRVMEIPLEKVNKLTKLIDNKTANEPLRDVIAKIPELKKLRQEGSGEEKEWIEFSAKLDGTIRNIGTHASGLIISDSPLTEVVPLYKDMSSSLVSTQFEGDYLEKNGLLKMDILGLSNLTMIRDTLLRIKKNRNVKIDLPAVSLDDGEVFRLFQRGETMGIFQFESPGMTDYMKKLKPTSIEDLIAMNALYRPGPMDNIPAFIARKQGKEEIDCFHKRLEPILKSTYGVIVYQEQVMQIAQVLAGFSLGKADVVRRMMAKKKPEELAKLKPEWIEGSVKNGFTKELAEKIFETLIPFSDYAFNKSHAAAYAVLAYQIAWLKAHYKLEFIASLLTLNMSNSENIRLYSQEAASSGIKILAPDINKSSWDFRETDFQGESFQGEPAIIFGFGAIKGLGEAISRAIIEEREIGGDFTSFDDFISRAIKHAEFKKGSVEILIKAGCFDNFYPPEKNLLEKAVLLHNLDTYVNQVEKNMKDKKQGRLNLFGGPDGGGHIETKADVAPLTLKEDFANEVALFGFYLSGKLFQYHKIQYGTVSHCSGELISRLKPGTYMLLCGFINDLIIKTGSNNKSYAIFTLDNGTGSFKIFLFSEKYIMFKNFLIQHNFIMMKCAVAEGKGGNILEVSSIKPIELLPQERFTELHIFLENSESAPGPGESLGFLKNIISSPSSRGMIRIIFHIVSDKEREVIHASERYSVKYTGSLMREIAALPNILGYWLY
jgi:DNA polymerase-3 subunit alpha